MSSKFLKSIILRVMSNVFPSWMFKVHYNRIVATSLQGRSFGSNPAAVINELLKIDSENKPDIVWLLRDFDEVANLPIGVRAVKYNSIRSFYELATARIWLDDSRKRYFPRKKCNQYYFQLWHGAITLKYVERDAVTDLDRYYLYDAKRDASASDFMVSGSVNTTELYKKSFWFNGRVLEFGTPRVDELIANQPGGLNSVNRFFDIDDETNVILYAPTFRSDLSQAKKAYDIHFDGVVEQLEHKTGRKWRLFLKLHPNIAYMEKSIISNSKYVIGASSYGDAQVLLKRAQVLITDYSSIMFDGMFAEDKVVLYTPDERYYSSKERGLYFGLDELPFGKTDDPQRIVETILNSYTNENDYKVEAFKEKIGSVEDGRASVRTADFIVNLMRNNYRDE